jgi:HAD superfamily hydrolase (TIGR01509 family)
MKAVLFDFDGVLVNSEPLHYRALRGCLLPEGIDVGEAEYARFYLAYDDWEAIRIAMERHGIASDAGRVQALAERKAELFDELLATVPLFPGARELVQALAREVPLAIASGALRGEIERILGPSGLRPLFAAVVGAEDVERGKPDPEPYLTAMRKLRARAPQLEPRDCVVIEDAMPGIAAGLAAGMKVVGVAQTYPADKLRAAHLVVDGVAELDVERLRALFG